MVQSKKVIVITLNYNQNDYTLKCIDSLLNSDYDNFRILLIDNGSSEENYLLLKESLSKDSRVLLKRLNPNRGYVGGINFGLKEGEKMGSDYFLVMNNDTIIEKKAISALVKTAEKYGQKAIVTGKVYHYDEPNKLQDIGYFFKDRKSLLFERVGMDEIDTGQYDKEEKRDMLDDVFWLFPNKLFNEIGGYSTFFWYNYEQADFALRAKKIGYDLIYTPHAKIWHKGSVSIGGRTLNPVLAYWDVQGSLIFYYLHLKGWDFLRFFFNKLMNTIKTSGKATILYLKGDDHLRKYAYAKRAGFYYFIKWIFTKHKNIGEIPGFIVE